MQERKARGSCLCGAVAYEIAPPYAAFQYCHCSRCRKFTGSAHAANIILSPVQFKWLVGQDKVARFEIAQAKFFSTSFCTVCGSSLPWLTKDGQAMVVPAGTLDDDPGIKPRRNIFWGCKAPWFLQTCDLAKFEGRPDKK